MLCCAAHAEPSFPALLSHDNVKVMSRDGRGTDTIRNPLTYYCFRVRADVED